MLVNAQIAERFRRYKSGTYFYDGRCCDCGCLTAIDSLGLKVVAAKAKDGSIHPLEGVTHYLCDAFEGGRLGEDGLVKKPHALCT